MTLILPIVVHHVEACEAEYAAFLAADAIRWDSRETPASTYLAVALNTADVPYTLFKRLVAYATTAFTLSQFHTL